MEIVGGQIAEGQHARDDDRSAIQAALSRMADVAAGDDDEVIAAANRLGLSMVFTGVRHFRH